MFFAVTPGAAGYVKMASLFLIRHSQASFLQENYDTLSPLGEAQSRLLGEYWAQHKITFDRACVGPRARHKHTAQLVSEAFRKAGLAFPDQLVMPECDEYPAEDVLKRSLPALLETDPSIAKLHAAFKSSSESGVQRVTFEKLFETIIGMWARGEVSPPGVETWQEFCARVNQGLTKVIASGRRGERVAIFTSGGPIAVTLQRALYLSPEITVGVSWMSRNSSWSEFLYDANRVTLSTFNSHAHIDDPAMLTYR
jgi:broad specificity phosphatase PhoE